MRLNCGLTYSDAIAARQKWHRKFAWWPIKIASHDCRWLETIERKGTMYRGCARILWSWEYRALPKKAASR